MTKNNKRLMGLFIILLIFFIAVLNGLHVDCLFKQIFDIACPSCGLTRSIYALLHFNIKLSFYYNILGIPFFIMMVMSYILIVIDVIKKKNYLSNFWLKISRYYIVIVILLIMTFIVNNYHKI